MPGPTSAAAFSLRIPAAGFVVDDAALRREEGADFAEETSEDAKSGTLRNMLSPALLDAAQFPAITVRSLAVTVAHGALEASLVGRGRGPRVDAHGAVHASTSLRAA